MCRHSSILRIWSGASTTWSTTLLWFACNAVVVTVDADVTPGDISYYNWDQDQAEGGKHPRSTTDGSTSICNRYGGIGHASQRFCCSAECGEFCGAENCDLAPGGSGSCCPFDIILQCGTGVSAPCLLLGGVTNPMPIATTTTSKRPLVVDDQAPVQYESYTPLWWILLVAILVCCFVVSFVRNRKTAKVAATVAELDLEASQASASPLMFKATGARDVSIMPGAMPSESSRTAGAILAETSTTPIPQIESQPSGASRGVPLVWETPGGERTVYVTKSKLGLSFHSKFPLEVKREPEGHAKELGVHAGWVLKSVNGVEVTPTTDLDAVLRVGGKRPSTLMTS